MPDYEEILDSEVQPEAPLTSSLGVRFRDNPLAIAEGASGAPRIQTGGIEDNAVTNPKIASNAVSQPNIQSNSVGRSEARSGTSSASGTLDEISSFTAISMDDWALFPSFGGSSSIRLTLGTSSSSASSPKIGLRNTSLSTRSYDIAWRFINS